MTCLKVADGKGSQYAPSSFLVSTFKEWDAPKARLRQSLPAGTDRSWACLAESWPDASPHQYLPTILHLPCWIVWGSGFNFPFSFKHARHLNIRISVFCFSGEHPEHQAVRYLGSTSHLPFTLCFFWKTMSYLPWRAGMLESQTKRNARRVKLFLVQVYIYNSYKNIEQPRIIII